jgi:cobalamin synthase
VIAARKALAYFTIFPGAQGDGPPEGPTLAWLPFVGALVGAICGGCGWLGWRYLGAPWGAVVPFVLAIVITGALHLDGYLDCCDALFASVSTERRREILKDPRHGTFAFAGGILGAVVWLAALSRFPYANLGLWPSVFAMAAIAAVARMAAVANLDARRRPAIARVYGVLAAPATLATYALKRWACGRLGGAESGDIYGACIVLMELAGLVALSLID